MSPLVIRAARCVLISKGTLKCRLRSLGNEKIGSKIKRGIGTAAASGAERLREDAVTRDEPRSFDSN